MLRYQNILSGIQGVSSLGNASINLDVNKRYHGLRLFCGSGTTIIQTAITSFINTFQLDVNGVKMFDWTPTLINAANALDGVTTQTGEIFVPFSLPRFAGFRDMNVTSFDLAGQNTFQAILSLQSIANNPSIVALQEYDYERNTVPYGPNAGKFFLRPLKRLRQSFPVSNGVTDITQIPIINPLKRLILVPDNAGTITHYEVYADNVKVDEGDVQNGSSATWLNLATARQVEYGITLPSLPLAYVPIDFCYTKRLQDALTAKNNLILRLTSSSAQNVVIGEEFICGAYA